MRRVPLLTCLKHPVITSSLGRSVGDGLLAWTSLMISVLIRVQVVLSLLLVLTMVRVVVLLES